MPARAEAPLLARCTVVAVTGMLRGSICLGAVAASVGCCGQCPAVGRPFGWLLAAACTATAVLTLATIGVAAAAAFVPVSSLITLRPSQF